MRQYGPGEIIKKGGKQPPKPPSPPKSQDHPPKPPPRARSANWEPRHLPPRVPVPRRPWWRRLLR
ncbi:MAG TPA: hypothetical protein VGR26_14985 [Acidimicrobiales bacterium]|nr:hypothetical protein [Acidimicrobiales bacterium]